MNRPKIKENIDLAIIIDSVENYMDQVEEGYVSEDTEHYIFEDVIRAVYGDDVWKYVNEKVK